MKSKIETLKLIVNNPILFLEVLTRSFLISIALRVAPLAKISTYCAKPRRRAPNPELVHRFSTTLERKLSKRPSCLRSSLVLFSMIPSEAKFIVGVDKQNNLLEAHAWVETKEEIFSGALDWNRYQTILSVQK